MLPAQQGMVKNGGVNFGFKLAGVACLLALVHLGWTQERPVFDLASTPLYDWLTGSEHTDIPWDLKVHDAFLRMDQLLEVPYYAHIDDRALNNYGSEPDFYLITRVSTDDGEWLDEPNVARYSIQNESRPLTYGFPYFELRSGMTPAGGGRALHPGNELQYSVRFFAQPGNYVLWVVLVDQVSHKHNVAKRHIKGGAA